MAWPGTQHNPRVRRGENGVPREGAGTIATIGNLKEMSPEWLAGASILGYGVSLYVGIGIPIPILNEEMARYTAVKDEDIFTQIYDYSMDYPKGWQRVSARAGSREVWSGTIPSRRPENLHRPPLQLFQGQGNCQSPQGMD